MSSKIRIRKRGNTYSYSFDISKHPRRMKEKGGFATEDDAFDAGVAAYGRMEERQYRRRQRARDAQRLSRFMAGKRRPPERQAHDVCQLPICRQASHRSILGEPHPAGAAPSSYRRMAKKLGGKRLVARDDSADENGIVHRAEICDLPRRADPYQSLCRAFHPKERTEAGHRAHGDPP